MIECEQCYYTFKVTDGHVLTKEDAGVDLDGKDILIECPRCKGQMFFEFLKTIPQGEIEE